MSLFNALSVLLVAKGTEVKGKWRGAGCEKPTQGIATFIRATSQDKSKAPNAGTTKQMAFTQIDP